MDALGQRVGAEIQRRAGRWSCRGCPGGPIIGGNHDHAPAFDRCEFSDVRLPMTVQATVVGIHRCPKLRRYGPGQERHQSKDYVSAERSGSARAGIVARCAAYLPLHEHDYTRRRARLGRISRHGHDQSVRVITPHSSVCLPSIPTAGKTIARRDPRVGAVGSYGARDSSRPGGTAVFAWFVVDAGCVSASLRAGREVGEVGGADGFSGSITRGCAGTVLGAVVGAVVD